MAQCLPFERTKHIDDKYKHAIFGYVRTRIMLEIPESILLVILLFYYSKIQSSILTDNECDELLSLFEKENVFKNVNNYSYKLLFRGTRDGFEAETFYARCNEPNTICIIHTPQNNIFGGFTSIPWNRTDSNWGKYQTDQSAFIYSLRSTKSSHPKLFPVQNNGRNAVAHCKNVYLKFGLYGYGFYVKQNSYDTTVWASSDGCPGYRISPHELNGVDWNCAPVEIEVFKLV